MSVGSLAGAVRPLLGTRDRQPHGMTLIDLKPSGEVEITALVEPDFRSVLPWSKLPQSVVRGEKELTRFDRVH